MRCLKYSGAIDYINIKDMWTNLIENGGSQSCEYLYCGYDTVGDHLWD